ncbi:hypothetical protein [Paenibacillus macquariensis]|uniref:Uncharacterized protein n=1 Tax=Paenibacillus macquariensis TaxID=948756 RepID=A0ABY1KIE8_9BACL|nr:hypothetical protein [Paenibacillus macquariensis]SIR72447.1 hypothetical protein SAMN05421578_1479 [Paenibacillus macquariensis]
MDAGGFPIKNGWILYSTSNKSHKLEIEANGSRVIINGEEDILKIRDKLNEMFPQKP